VARAAEQLIIATVAIDDIVTDLAGGEVVARASTDGVVSDLPPIAVDAWLHRRGA